MAAKVIRHASVFYQSKKVANATGGTLELPANFEDQIADEGWIGTTTGPKTSKVSLNAIVPIEGVGHTMRADMLNDKYVDITVGVVDGGICEIKDMKCSNVKYEWDVKVGSQTMSLEFSGGAPVWIG